MGCGGAFNSEDLKVNGFLYRNSTLCTRYEID